MQTLSWQAQLANLMTDIDELCAYVGLESTVIKARYQLPKKFALKVPHAFADKMTQSPNDPLLLQILPTQDELKVQAGFVLDPLAEYEHNPKKGLLHKYQSRVLVTLTGACAVHCRYCFRQHFDYQDNLPNQKDLADICQYIANDEQIGEVILSGGDPLSVSNRRLAMWLRALAAVPNIHTIRLHTRLPVVLPDRIDEELLTIFAHCSKKLVMVLHINHPQEIDDYFANYCAKLVQAGVILLNQSVLLKGINDDVEVLAQLSGKLFAYHIMPYYLHMLDKVAGAGHFWVDEYQAVQLYWALMQKVAGYLVPKLVQELPYQLHKTPVDIYKYQRMQ